MKVLLDNQIYESQKFGGITRYFNELQRENDAIKRIPFFRNDSPAKKSFIKKVELGLRGLGSKPSQSLENKYSFYLAELKKRNFNVFHPTYYNNYFLQTLVSLKKPFVLTVHDMIHERYPEYFGGSLDSINKRRLCEVATKIIAVSETTKKDIIDFFEISPDKIEVIYHATNFESISVSVPSFNFEEKEYLLFTGNRNFYKNFLTFLIAVAPLLTGKKNLMLICTGPEFNEIERKWMQDLNIQDNVKHYYCHNDNELVYLYQNAECLIFPSLYEGFGFPLLEAFASKCPVVSSSGGSLKEIAGDAAIYFDPKDVREMRQKINNLLTDSSLRQNLISTGKQRLKNFSWDICRQKTMDLYLRVSEMGTP